MSKTTLVAAAALLGLAASGALAYLLETRAAYRSPFWSAASEAPSPRSVRLRELAEFRRQREAAAAARVELLASLTTETMVTLGQEIVHGRGLCFNCHSIGGEGSGTQGPDLEEVGARAGDRIGSLTALEYLTQSLYEPGSYIVEGYASSMTPADQPPISLDSDEILMVIAYLQSLGGEATVEPGMDIPLGLDGR